VKFSSTVQRQKHNYRLKRFNLNLIFFLKRFLLLVVAVKRTQHVTLFVHALRTDYEFHGCTILSVPSILFFSCVVRTLKKAKQSVTNIVLALFILHPFGNFSYCKILLNE